MCEYIIFENTCHLTNQQCPYMFYCNSEKRWKPNKIMPTKCKVKQNMEIPQGYNKVLFERRGYLYVDLGKEVKKILNPFNDIPSYVKVKKNKKGIYKLSK